MIRNLRELRTAEPGWRYVTAFKNEDNVTQYECWPVLFFAIGDEVNFRKDGAEKLDIRGIVVGVCDMGNMGLDVCDDVGNFVCYLPPEWSFSKEHQCGVAPGGAVL